MNNELKKIARRINRDGYINNHDNDTSKEGTLHKDAGAVVLLAKDSIGLWSGANSCINSCYIADDGYVHLSTYSNGGTIYKGAVVPTQEDIDAYNATVIDSCKIIDWILLTYKSEKDEEKKANKSNITIELKGFSIYDIQGRYMQPILSFNITIPQVIYNDIKEDKVTIDSILSLDFNEESSNWHFYAPTFSENFPEINWKEKMNSMILKLNSMELTPSLNHSLFIIFETISEILEEVTNNEYGFLYFTKENKKIMKEATGGLIAYNCKRNRIPFSRNN